MSSPVAVVAMLDKNARERCRVALDEFKGTRLIDLRVCVPPAAPSDAMTPTRAGVALNVALLPKLRAALADAEAKAIELGWL